MRRAADFLLADFFAAFRLTSLAILPTPAAAFFTNRPMRPAALPGVLLALFFEAVKPATGGRQYCHLIAPDYLKRVLLGEVQLPRAEFPANGTTASR